MPFATAGADVRLWRTNPLQLVMHGGQSAKSLRDLCFSREGRYLVTAGDNQTARPHDLETLRSALP
jgi:hypothetical protein